MVTYYIISFIIISATILSLDLEIHMGHKQYKTVGHPNAWAFAQELGDIMECLQPPGRAGGDQQFGTC